MQIKIWLEEARNTLKEVSQSPSLDAQILLMCEIGKSKSWVLSHPDYEIQTRSVNSLEKMLKRALIGEPIPYIIGHWEFYGLDFQVTPDVLIPRPETEMIVEKAQVWLKKNQGQKILDLGTGSGCISIALAVSNPSVTIVSADSSRKALKIAQKNAIHHQVRKRIIFTHSNLFSQIRGNFDIICANLPYIPREQLKLFPISKFEPIMALDGGNDGLMVISDFLRKAFNFMNIPGLLLCEYGMGQENPIKKLAKLYFPHPAIETFSDLQGISRLLSIKLEK
jgi:release factor glutamine methyltransferase